MSVGDLQLDNYVITLAATVHKLGVPLDTDGWPVVPTRDAAVAFHLGRFIYHAARIGGGS